MPPRVDVRRAADRFRTRTEWLDSYHSFSFGAHYDPYDTGHGRLVVHNHDVIAPGRGFDPHEHRDMEIVTWVLSGALVHEDSTGRRGVLRPGLAQRMSAGSGVRHSERNDAGPDGGAPTEPVELVQMWVLPDRSGGPPGYEQRDVADVLAADGAVTVASGLPWHRDVAATGLGTAQAALHVLRPGPDGHVLPEAPWLHAYVARGSVVVEGDDAGRLGPGDALRLTDSGARRVTSGGGAEVLVWEMHRSDEDA